MVKRNALRTMIFAFAGFVVIVSANADSLARKSAIGNKSAICAGTGIIGLMDYSGNVNLKNPNLSCARIAACGWLRHWKQKLHAANTSSRQWLSKEPTSAHSRSGESDPST